MHKVSTAAFHSLRTALVLLANVSVFFLLTSAVVHAAEFIPLAETPGGSKLGTLYASGDFSSFINGLFKFALAIGAIVAVLRLAYAGYLYMGQSDMWSHKGVAKGIIADVTLGLLLLLSIYLILFQINPDILKLNALKRITPVQQAPATQSGNGEMPPGLLPSGLPINSLDSAFIGTP